MCDLSKRDCILQSLLIYVTYTAYNCLTSPNSDARFVGLGVEVQANSVDSELSLGRLFMGMLQQATANHSSAKVLRRGL